MEKKKNWKDEILIIFLWTFSIIFFISGINSIGKESVLGGIFFILTGIFMNPLIRKIIKKNLKINLSKNLLIGVILVCLIGAFIFTGGLSNDSSQENPTFSDNLKDSFEEANAMIPKIGDPSSNEEVQEIIPEEISVFDKISDFTMDDCYEICEGYPMAINTNICQGNCEMYGKPSSKLDTYCLASIESVKRSQ